MQKIKKNFGRRNTRMYNFGNEIVVVNTKGMLFNHLKVQRVGKRLIIYNSETGKYLRPVDPNYYKDIPEVQ